MKIKLLLLVATSLLTLGHTERALAAEAVVDFASPTATFDSAKHAMLRADYESFGQCFTKEGRSLMVGSLRMMTRMIAWAGEQDNADQRSVHLAQGIDRINRRYEKSPQPAEVQLDLNASSEDFMAIVRQMAEPINDHSAYLAAVFKLLHANDNRPQKTPPLADAILQNLEIQGDLATATMRGTFLIPRKSKEPITFRRVGLTWKIDQLGSFGAKISENNSSNNSSPAKLIIRADKKPEKFDRKGLASIHHAASNGNLTKLRRLIAEGEDVNLQQRNLRGTALHYAADAGHAHIVRELLKHRADTEARDTRGYSPLLLAAKNGHTKIVKLLLDGGANIQAKPDVGEWTALSLAIRAKQRETAQFLLDHGAKFSQHESFARNMRRSATRLGLQLPPNQLPTAKPITKKKQPRPKKIALPVLPEVSKLKPIDQPNEKGFSKLHYAARIGDVVEMQTLLDQGASVDVRQRTFCGTPLQYAASAGRVEGVHLLIKHKATTDATDLSLRTPLMWAAWKGHADVVQALLDAGADIHKTSRGTRWTALHFAADKGQLEAAQLLIERGASPSTKNTQGKTPLDLNPNIAPPE